MTILNRISPLLDGLATAKSREPVTRATEVHSPRVTPVGLSRPTAIRTHRLANDANSSQLVNFAFALTGFVILGIGLLTVFCGMVLPSAWLAVVGLLFTLAGGGMYGWSLCDA